MTLKFSTLLLGVERESWSANKSIQSWNRSRHYPLPKDEKT